MSVSHITRRFALAGLCLLVTTLPARAAITIDVVELTASDVIFADGFL